MVTLGHVVFYVRNLEQSLSFYRDVVGLEVVGQIFDGRAAMVAPGILGRCSRHGSTSSIPGVVPPATLVRPCTSLTGGATHHELLLIEVGNAPGPLAGRRIGLYHVGWKIGESLAELRKARDRILARGHAIDGLSDHTVSQSIYLRDPEWRCTGTYKCRGRQEPRATNEIELFVDDPRADWKSSREWLQEPVKPLRL